MATIHHLGGKRVFTREQAQELVPVLLRITRGAQAQIEEKLGFLAQAEGPRRDEIEEEVHRIFDGWQEKVLRLGGVTKGMWLVDFDNGEGYLCWRFPEADVAHYHGYHEGYGSRVKLH